MTDSRLGVNIYTKEEYAIKLVAEFWFIPENRL